MSIDINQAWDKLHTRLRDDQLLTSGNEKAALPFITQMKWAATIAILCICSVTISLYLFRGKESGQLLSIQNNDISNTLVNTLGDGSIVYLTSGAIVTYPEQFATDKRQISLQGEALFDVQSNRACPFLIETEPVLVEVVGTAFNIKSTGKELFELSVQHGLVKVTLKTTGAEVLVEAGETIRLLDNHQLQKDWSGNQQQFAQYTEKMHFKDERLDNIVKVINKMSDIPVAFADSSLMNKKITITFLNNTPSDMVDLLCIPMGLNPTNNGDSILIDKK